MESCAASTEAPVPFRRRQLPCGLNTGVALTSNVSFVRPAASGSTVNPAQLMNCSFVLRPALLCSALLIAGTQVSGQVAPAPATDAATPTRYDANRNGRLDPEEIRAMDANRQRVASSDVRAGDETVVLSPFEVVSDNRGYFASNTMSGTRLNTKLEDLASSITVITKE